MVLFLSFYVIISVLVTFAFSIYSVRKLLWNKWLAFVWTGWYSCNPTDGVKALEKTKHWPHSFFIQHHTVAGRGIAPLYWLSDTVFQRSKVSQAYNYSSAHLFQIQCIFPWKYVYCISSMDIEITPILPFVKIVLCS